MKSIRSLAAAAFLFSCSGSSTSPQPTTPPADGNTGATPTPTPEPSQAECKPTGCSGTVCSDQEVMTTCEFKPEYACYKTAMCARQADGACGWTKSAELDACLANPPPMQ